MSKKTRLDVLLTERGLCESRQKAQATIMAGLVFVDGQRSDKPGTQVAEDASVEVRGHALRYVSRGGLKLEKAMQTFPITLEGKVCADIGASTGGFTDCMLQNGAAKVYAVDVGYGQLDWKLRSDERVVAAEDQLRAGAVGERLGALLLERGAGIERYALRNAGEALPAQGSTAQLRHVLGLDAEGMAQTVREVLK